jgi:hypothetical protein
MRLLSYNNSELVAKFVLKVKYTMRTSFTYFLIICSLILVLGHSFLPHSHIERQKGMCEVSESRYLTIAEIIKISLAHNLGSNHLEEFNKCEKSTYIHRVSSKEYIGHESKSIKTSNYLIAMENIILPEVKDTDDYYFTDTYLRAPPSKS